MAAHPKKKTVHKLKISIAGIKPPVWRRVEVPSDASLADLHQVIQQLFGWWGYHLHEFEVGGERYGADDEADGGWGEPAKDERRAKLGAIAPAGSSFLYTYDFGDDWEHRITVEDVTEANPERAYPRCLAGRRAAPPEDVGGSWGYMAFLEALAEPDREDHDEMLEWVGGSFDPAAFDIDAINARLPLIP